MSNKDKSNESLMLLDEKRKIGYIDRNTVYLAKEMDPNIKEWEQLGFVFANIPGDNVLCKAMLPEGWSMKDTDYSSFTDIIDENGMKRGSVFFINKFDERKAYMSLEQRYRVCTSRIGDGSMREVYFGNDEERLFVAGQIHESVGASRKKLSAQVEELKRLNALSKQFGDKNYPGWESVHSYWGNANELSQESTR